MTSSSRGVLRTAALLAVLVASVAQAQPYQVKDINPTAFSYGFSSAPTQLINVNGTLLFAADDGTTGYELWKSDGTDAGTVRVKDINVGGGSALLFYRPGNTQQINFNGTLVFAADDGITGYELWKSDGTAAGTVRVKDINPGSAPSYPSPFINVSGTLFFTAADGVSGRELWKSDGTEAGTVRVKDINPGQYGIGETGSIPLINLNGTVFFTASDGTSGYELWKSDGTAAGTVRVKDIQPGPSGSSPSYLTSVNGTLFFAANDGTSGVELWKSDGTAAGTVRVRDIEPGTFGSSPKFLFAFNGTLFFWASEKLWKSDGTDAGTVQVSTRPLWQEWASGSFTPEMTIANGTLFFSAEDSSNSALGVELWKSDGTEAGTVRLTTMTPPSTGYYGNKPRFLTNLNGTLFFAGTNTAGGQELWKSDGTAAGTVRVKDIGPGAVSSAPSDLTVFGAALFFTACDTEDLWNHQPTNCELWKSDGTDAGTVRVKDVYPGAGSHPFGSLPVAVGRVGADLFFAAHDGTSRGLWKSDGTEAGTVHVKSLDGFSLLEGGVDVGGTLYFVDGGTAGYELWRSDGSEAGTVRVKDIQPGPAGSNPESLTNVNGTLFFAADDGVSGAELWKSDGTESGTVRVKDILPGPGGSNPFSLINVNNTLFFAAEDGTSGYELWKSDGTASGTIRVRDINPGGDSSPEQLTQVNGTLFFAASENDGDEELWKSDGTAAGTVRVKNINTTPGWGSYPEQLTEVDGNLFFLARSGTAGGLELFRSDGTAAGTVQLKAFCCDFYGDPHLLTNVNGTLFFLARETSSYINEPGLWKSDGTESGTVRIKAVKNPEHLTNANGTLFFEAEGDDGWKELWKSDGSDSGTVRVAALGKAIYRFSLTFMGSRVLFVANEGVANNEEFWALDLLTVLRDGGGCGVVTSAPTGIQCGSRCGAPYDFGSLVDLTATPTANSSFAGWSGVCSGTASCQVSTNGAQIVTATFSRVSNASNDGDLDGIPDGVEATEGKSRCVKDNDIFASARLFAMQQYRDFLGRESDPGGVAAWVSSIGGGTSRAVATKSFFDSPEFQGAIAPVARLYFAYFNRIPDKPGLDYWIGQYKLGLPLNNISQAFAGSPEFITTYGSLSNSAFVTLVYNNVLGRAPDATGLAFWTMQLNSGLRTRGQVMVGFSESPEYQARSYNRVFVTMTYYGMLRRVPDQGGFDFWVANLNAGVPTLNLIDGFLAAPEYHGRFLP